MEFLFFKKIIKKILGGQNSPLGDPKKIKCGFFGKWEFKFFKKKISQSHTIFSVERLKLPYLDHRFLHVTSPQMFFFGSIL